MTTSQINNLNNQPIPSLTELCGSIILSGQLPYTAEEITSASHTGLDSLWENLKSSAKQGAFCALGLQGRISQIERSTPSKEAFRYFHALTKECTPLFEEAGIPLGNNEIPINCMKYAELEKILKEKWGDEALLTIWTDPSPSLQSTYPDDQGLLRTLTDLGVFQGQPIPQSIAEIRAWLNDPANVVHLNRISAFYRQGAGIKVFPSEISNLHNLTSLNLSSNQLRSFNVDLTSFPRLSFLYLQKNQLDSFDANLKNCFQLTGIFLDENILENFFVDFSGCTKLAYLYLSQNKVKIFAANLSTCYALKSLSLGNNEIEMFATDLSDCTRLEEIILSNNKLKSFPMGRLKNHTQLKYASFFSNPMPYIYVACENSSGWWGSTVDLPAINACVKCDVGYGNTLGTRYDTPGDKNWAWACTELFRWTENGWEGKVPQELEFKFVSVSPNKEIKWEKREGNRTALPVEKGIVFEKDEVQF